MVFERKIFLMSSLIWANPSAQSRTYAGYNQSQSNNQSWTRVPMIKAGNMTGHACHFYTNNATPYTVSVNINGVRELNLIFNGTTGLQTIYEDVPFSAGDTVVLYGTENSFSTIIRGYSMVIGVFD